MAKRKRVDIYDLAFLAAQLEDARRGGGFEAFSYEEIKVILQTAFPFSPKIPDTQRGSVLDEGIHNAAESGKIDEKTLKSGVRKAEQKLLNTKPFAAVLVTSVSLMPPPPFRARTIAAAGVTLYRQMPNRFRTERGRSALRIPEADQFQREYAAVKVKATGRSNNEAFEDGLAAFDLRRSYWNYQMNRKKLLRLFGGVVEPVNRYRLGRVHTLHALDGSSLVEGHWFEPSFHEVGRSQISTSVWTELLDAERRIVRRMNKHPYREALERVFLRYTRALDSADFESVFLKLWSLMEHLTDAAGQNYDEVVKRALFLFSDRKLTRQLLEHLRDQRNAIVHDEGTDTDVERLAFQAKRIVEALMRFHLNTGRHYESIAEAATILSQPCSRVGLDARIKLSRAAIRFLGV